MCSRFVLIRYGEIHRHGNGCPEGSFYTHKLLEIGDMTCHVEGIIQGSLNMKVFRRQRE